MIRKVNLRPETEELMEKSRGMVKAFYSEKAYKGFDHALRTKISIENVPNMEFEKNRTSAIVELASELGINNRSIWQSLTTAWRRMR